MGACRRRGWHLTGADSWEGSEQGSCVQCVGSSLHERLQRGAGGPRSCEGSPATWSPWPGPPAGESGTFC